MDFQLSNKSVFFFFFWTDYGNLSKGAGCWVCAVLTDVPCCGGKKERKENQYNLLFSYSILLCDFLHFQTMQSSTLLTSSNKPNSPNRYSTDTTKSIHIYSFTNRIPSYEFPLFLLRPFDMQKIRLPIEIFLFNHWPCGRRILWRCHNVDNRNIKWHRTIRLK